jgi:hypothetical protein
MYQFLLHLRHNPGPIPFRTSGERIIHRILNHISLLPIHNLITNTVSTSVIFAPEQDTTDMIEGIAVEVTVGGVVGEGVQGEDMKALENLLTLVGHEELEITERLDYLDRPVLDDGKHRYGTCANRKLTVSLQKS